VEARLLHVFYDLRTTGSDDRYDCMGPSVHFHEINTIICCI
jgi:hypothetical protein